MLSFLAEAAEFLIKLGEVGVWLPSKSFFCQHSEHFILACPLLFVMGCFLCPSTQVRSISTNVRRNLAFHTLSQEALLKEFSTIS
jgi:hypothetical protein